MEAKKKQEEKVKVKKNITWYIQQEDGFALEIHRENLWQDKWPSNSQWRMPCQWKACTFPKLSYHHGLIMENLLYLQDQSHSSTFSPFVEYFHINWYMNILQYLYLIFKLNLFSFIHAFVLFQKIINYLLRNRK